MKYAKTAVILWNSVSVPNRKKMHGIGNIKLHWKDGWNNVKYRFGIYKMSLKFSAHIPKKKLLLFRNMKKKKLSWIIIRKILLKLMMTLRKLFQCFGKRDKLKQQKKQMEQMAEHSKVMEARTKEIMGLIADQDLDLTEYSDTMVYRIVEKVTVFSKEEIRIRFIGGFEMTQRLI